MTPALLVLASLAAAQGKPLGAVANEAVSLEEPQRSAAMHVQRSHFETFLAAFAPLTLEGGSPADPSKRATCSVRFAIGPKSLPPNAVVEGLVLRRAQPLFFNEFQLQVVEGVKACRKSLVFTEATTKGVRDRSLDLLAALSGTTYCLEDKGCELTRVDPSSCGGRQPATLAASETTDWVLTIAYRKFMPALFSFISDARNEDMRRLGKRHPDAGKRTDCARPLWTEKPLPSVCVRHSCREKP